MSSRALRRVRNIIPHSLYSKQASFFLGLTVAVAIFIGLIVSYQIVTDTSIELHTAELEYATYSLATGDTGASVIPASCDSGVSHWAGDLAGCMSWVTYCTGGGNADPANDWDWWQYSDTDQMAGRQYRYLSEGNGSCTPPPRATIPWINASCYNSQQNMYFDWGAVAADRYGVSFYGLTAGECSAMGWSYEYSGNSCSYLNWSTSQTAISLGTGGMYGLGNMSGRSVTLYVIAGDPWGAWNGAGVTCTPPTPLPAPTGLTYSCSSGGTVANISWNPVAGASRYLPRIVGVTPAQCASYGFSWYSPDGTCYYDYWSYNYISLTITPDTNYSFWVHSGDPVNGAQAASVAINCPSPGPIPAPTSITKTCSYNGDVVTIDWADSPGATKYYINLGGFTQSYCSTIGWTWHTPDNYTCYYHNWQPAWGSAVSLAVVPGNTYNANVWAGDPVIANWAQYAGTGNFSCPAPPPPPTGPSGSCNAAGTTGTFSWTAPGGYNTFMTRVSTTGIGATTGTVADGWDENFVGTSKSFTTTPGTTYYYWVHTKDTNRASPNWSSGYVSGSFTCPTPAPTVPTGRSASCTVTNGVGQATFTWTGVANATSYNLTVNGVTYTNVSPGRVVNGLGMQSYPWSVQACGVSGCSAQGSDTVSCVPQPATISLAASPTLIRSGESGRLTWSVTAAYPTRCVLTGAGSATFDYAAGTSANSPNPYLTSPINNATDFTLTCSANPAITGVQSASATVRVGVVPNVEEI